MAESSARARLLRPLSPQRNRTSAVVDRIAAEIHAGILAAGDRLPTEQELMQAMGVSRTVVREAVAALKAEGLVVTRQGSGAFVAADTSRIAFRIDRLSEDAIDTVLSVMELRLAVEVEAAALAADRANAGEKAAIRRAHQAFRQAIERGEAAVREDFTFHLAIAQAVHNARFVEFLSFLGTHLIPRHIVRPPHRTAGGLRTYLDRIAKEHARILEAIASGLPAEARKAMRVHLTSSLSRYRKLAGGTTQPGA
ncbi:MAG: FadR/GntR family transcriptional regulator [Hyphomicrobiaceae bacterium]|nr:FadR/GntR family transcriptional regulator [Hyphomicrobiaceae bacterium]